MGPPSGREPELDDAPLTASRAAGSPRVGMLAWPGACRSRIRRVLRALATPLREPTPAASGLEHHHRVGPGAGFFRVYLDESRSLTRDAPIRRGGDVPTAGPSAESGIGRCWPTTGRTGCSGGSRCFPGAAGWPVYSTTRWPSAVLASTMAGRQVTLDARWRLLGKDGQSSY